MRRGNTDALTPTFLSPRLPATPGQPPVLRLSKRQRRFLRRLAERRADAAAGLRKA